MHLLRIVLAIAALAVFVLAPTLVGSSTLLVAAPASETPTATPEPDVGLCTLAGRQTADVARVERGQTVGLTLRLTASCPAEARGRADVLLVYDRSASMAEDGKHAAALAAVQAFLDNVDFTRHRVGLVPFNDAPSIIQSLTERRDRLQRALAASPPPAGSTDIARALRGAASELAATGRREAVGVVVLLTDGQSNEEAMRAAAGELRSAGTVLFTVGLGADAAQAALRSVATTPEHFYYAPDPDQLADIYHRIASILQTFSVTDVVLVDEPAAGVDYVAGSAAPFEPGGSGSLNWRHSFVPPGGITVTYRVRPTRAGPEQPSQAVFARYVDGDGVMRRLEIEPARVEVFAPAVRPYFLPLLFRNQCLPAVRYADVVLGMDVSSSMAEENKLREAIVAAKAFLGVLKLPADQAAVVTYHGEASLAQPLTGDRDLLEARLDALGTRSGTRLDRGIDVAVAELTSVRHQPASRRVLVLLTDGKQIEEQALIFASADLARRMGIAIFVIALGADADVPAMQIVAGSPSRVYRAVGPRDLVEIYTQIAGIVACR